MSGWERVVIQDGIETVYIRDDDKGQGLVDEASARVWLDWKQSRCTEKGWSTVRLGDQFTATKVYILGSIASKTRTFLIRQVG